MQFVWDSHRGELTRQRFSIKIHLGEAKKKDGGTRPWQREKERIIHRDASQRGIDDALEGLLNFIDLTGYSLSSSRSCSPAT
jgi:hypothetical protein